MVFTSFIFVFWFLPLFLAGYYVLPLRGRNLLLTLASYCFYAWWRPEYVILMLVSTLVDWCCAGFMRAPGSGRRRGLWLIISLCTNLGLLAYFKYMNLLFETINQLQAAVGGDAIAWEKVILPIGISFFTFQSMSYTIDVYKGKVRPVRSLLDLACYVSMFPQLVAGPIVRYRTIEDQLRNRELNLQVLSAGCLLFMMGFAKKILLADQVEPFASQAFGMADPGFLEAWTGVLAFTVQIYFDFSGYSDMAIGLGLLLGFKFPKNFDSPYKSQSITEFWRRWHMSLSSWLRDYLYIPLGGNRHGPVRTYVALMATMLLGGFWHGAAWTFVLWGGYQGFFLVLERRRGRRTLYSGLPAIGRVAVTFLIVVFGWAIFKAPDMATLKVVLAGMLGFGGQGAPIELPVYTDRSYVLLALGLCIAFFLPQSNRMTERFRLPTVVTTVLLFLLALGERLSADFSPFIYYRF